MTTKIPDVEFARPTCPMCGVELLDDEVDWRCPECNATWDIAGRHGRYSRSDADLVNEFIKETPNGR